MKEQSHKAEMATALRGDFARLRARGVATTLPTPPAVVEEASSAPAPAAAPVEPSHTSLAQALSELVSAPAAAPARGAAERGIASHVVAQQDAEPVPSPATEPRPATSWLDRLRGR